MITIDLDKDIATIQGDYQTLQNELLYLLGAYYTECERQTKTPLTDEQIFEDLKQKVLFAKTFFNKTRNTQ